MRRSFIMLVIALIVIAGVVHASREGTATLRLLEVDIAPREVDAGDAVKVSCVVSIDRKIEQDCFLFLHLEGSLPGAYINADQMMPGRTSEWQPEERIRLGPFTVHIPFDAVKGEYRMTMGLAHSEQTPRGTRYVKIPYANTDIDEWVVGRVKVNPRPPAVSQDEEGGLGISVVSSLEKVFPEEKYRPKGRADATLSCAGNEYESFQVVMIPGSRGIRGVRCEAGDLARTDGTGAIAKENIHLFKVGYVTTKRPYYNTLRVGPWPDPLIPLREEFDIAGGFVQPVWVTIYVPDGTPRGDYEGKISVTSSGGARSEVKVTVRVRGFSLPRETHLKSGFDLYENLVPMRHPKRPEESEARYKERMERLTAKYYVDMLEHRLSPIHNVGNPTLVSSAGGRYVLDFKEFDRKVQFYRARGQGVFGIAVEWPYGHAGQWTDQWYGLANREAVVGAFRAYGLHLRERGWIADAYTYIFDETFHRVKEITALIHTGDPGVRNLITMTPETGYPDVDIWCVRINNLERPIVRKFGEEGKEIWAYVAGHGWPYPSLNLDIGSIHYRVIPWICHKEKMQGLLYWCVNWWQRADPWIDPMTYGEQNGNGSLYYPSPEGDDPIGSIRLEVLRDGMEDYEYLSLLRQSVGALERDPRGREALVGRARALLNIPDEAVRSPAYYTRDPAVIYRLRDEIASVIEKAR